MHPHLLASQAGRHSLLVFLGYSPENAKDPDLAKSAEPSPNIWA